MKNPVSVPLEKCWEVPRKHCQSIPVKKPRIVVKKVPVKHCEYKGHHKDEHGYGHDDHHDDHHHGGGYGHHRRSDEAEKYIRGLYVPYRGKLDPQFIQKYAHSSSAAPAYPENPLYSSSYEKHKLADQHRVSSVPSYEEYGNNLYNHI